jgi:hypothetical protein
MLGGGARSESRIDPMATTGARLLTPQHAQQRQHPQ